MDDALSEANSFGSMVEARYDEMLRRAQAIANDSGRVQIVHWHAEGETCRNDGRGCWVFSPAHSVSVRIRCG